MFNLFAPSFFQKKICKLPGIGTLTLINTDAQSDFINTSIIAPKQEIAFTQSPDGENIFNEFSAISQLINEKLNAEGQVAIDGVGVFTKASGGAITFSSIQLDDAFMPPVHAERVVRQHAMHNMLVGDKETTNIAMSEMMQTDQQEGQVKNYWWIAAVILAVIAAATFILYYRQGGNMLLGNTVRL